ncbi:hypothetical protein [Actinoplanes regularis]|uniref:hypothetical protein n=1 Tax=Actinoplanes regularis TaxID=52697 RepID=UPI0024A0296A|nr:hypothetical protein [Actinoplanes regularis]GLW35642.1 hypothetical protein Areg01_85770 [Actinoplanes regularis]
MGGSPPDPPSSPAFHNLRHGAASLVGAASVIPHDMDHSSSVATADNYWTVLKELARAGVAAAAQLLPSPMPRSA